MDGMITRLIEHRITEALDQGFSLFLLGPRQTGKTTTLTKILAPLNHIAFNLMETRERLKYERNPSLISQEVAASGKGLVFIDEIQKVPEILDDVQVLIDREKKVFALTGSSARKLKRKYVNLLPGRTLHFRMDPLLSHEYRDAFEIRSEIELKVILKHGELPRILTLVAESREKLARDLLSSYVTTYLEEEVRAEALVRNIGSFTKFLKLAAETSGRLISLRSMAQDIGVTHATVSGHFQVLEDCLIVERIEPLIPAGERGKLRKAAKFLFFDTGVRNASAEVLGPADFTSDFWGMLFEQWVGLSILRLMRVKGIGGKLHYWRDYSGREIDWVIDMADEWIPVEVKWGDNPRAGDFRHLDHFVQAYKKKVKRGYLVFTGLRDRKINDNIFALSFRNFLERIFELAADSSIPGSASGLS
jgi:predicted AAA+ superfamily ATPase